MIPVLKKLYEEHANDCAREADRSDDPRRRELYLKLSREWTEAAKALGASS
jgi:hypothetical protein